jgi:hypothetical protein
MASLAKKFSRKTAAKVSFCLFVRAARRWRSE